MGGGRWDGAEGMGDGPVEHGLSSNKMDFQSCGHKTGRPGHKIIVYRLVITLFY